MTDQSQLPPIMGDDGRLVQYRGAAVSPDCQRCPRSTGGKPGNPVPAAGAMGNLAIVGEGPSTEELSQRYPFVGPSGKELNKIFHKYGIDRHAQWITNAILCSRPYTDADLDTAVMCCRPRLTPELQAVRPKAILALGKTAMRALMLDTQTMSDARGTVQESPLVPGVPVITTIHPAALLRGGAGETTNSGSQKQNVDAQMMFLEADILKAYRIAQGVLEPKWSDDIMVVIEPGPAPLSAATETALAEGSRAVQEGRVSPVPAEVLQAEAARPAPPVADPVPSIVTDLPVIEDEPTRPGVPAPFDDNDDPTQPGVPPPATPSAAQQVRSLAALDPRCSVCQRKQYATPSGVTCSAGHGDAPPAAPPAGISLNPAPRHPDWAVMATPSIVNLTPAASVACAHAQYKVGVIGVECLTCGMRAVCGLDGVMGEWFVPGAVAEPAAVEVDPAVAADAYAKANPAVMQALQELYNRIGDRDLFVELTATVASEAF